MKKCIFLSSLLNREQRGGAFLRNKAIISIYEWLGYEVEIIYRESIQETGRLSSLLKSLYYGSAVRSLFTRAQVDIQDCDLLHIDHLRYLNWNFNFLGKKPFILYNAHNLEFESYFAECDRHTPQALRFKKYELEMIKSVDLTLVCSKREQTILLNNRPDLQSKTFVLPNLVDQGDYELCRSGDKKYVSFIGTLDYYPNIQAVNFICDDLYPALDQSTLGHYQFVIAGRSPSQEIKNKCRACGIELRENLSDQEILELYAQTYISLVPLMHGSGTRLKVLESLFSGAHVLSTPLGREGIEGDEIITCDLEHFAKAIEEIIVEQKTVTISDTFKEHYDTKSWFDKERERLKVALGN